ncbi:hypothetical protein HGA92_03530 [Candidatus Gracilibacteria bacterium]|nr:hypothetical protein [Candidatus Gracilibacteria bacterium]NUJ99169.1 hypothetical protein [Candidatus Gracilibacteria bacterium]
MGDKDNIDDIFPTNDSNTGYQELGFTGYNNYFPIGSDNTGEQEEE